MKMPKRPEIKLATYAEPVKMHIMHTRTWIPAPALGGGFKFNLMITSDGKFHVDVLPLSSVSNQGGISLNAYDEPFTDIDLALAAIDKFIESGLPVYIGA